MLKQWWLSLAIDFEHPNNLMATGASQVLLIDYVCGILIILSLIIYRDRNGKQHNNKPSE
jgi:hypothetical protein